MKMTRHEAIALCSLFFVLGGIVGIPFGSSLNRDKEIKAVAEEPAPPIEPRSKEELSKEALERLHGKISRMYEIIKSHDRRERQQGEEIARLEKQLAVAKAEVEKNAGIALSNKAVGEDWKAIALRNKEIAESWFDRAQTLESRSPAPEKSPLVYRSEKVFDWRKLQNSQLRDIYREAERGRTFDRGDVQNMLDEQSEEIRNQMESEAFRERARRARESFWESGGF